jgi:hypothetical protein
VVGNCRGEEDDDQAAFGYPVHRFSLGPFYNFREPALFGFPFYCLCQLAWVPVSALLTYLVYLKVKHDG